MFTVHYSSFIYVLIKTPWCLILILKWNEKYYWHSHGPVLFYCNLEFLGIGKLSKQINNHKQKTEISISFQYLVVQKVVLSFWKRNENLFKCNKFDKNLIFIVSIDENPAMKLNSFDTCWKNLGYLNVKIKPSLHGIWYLSSLISFRARKARQNFIINNLKD